MQQPLLPTKVLQHCWRCSFRPAFLVILAISALASLEILNARKSNSSEVAVLGEALTASQQHDLERQLRNATMRSPLDIDTVVRLSSRLLHSRDTLEAKLSAVVGHKPLDVGTLHSILAQLSHFRSRATTNVLLSENSRTGMEAPDMPPKQHGSTLVSTNDGQLIASRQATFLSPSSNSYADHDIVRDPLSIPHRTDSHFKQQPPSVMVAVARIESDDTTWLSDLGGIAYELWTEPNEGRHMHDVEDLARNMRAKPRTHEGGSTRECGAYLHFIVEHYENLPEISIFVQGQPLRQSSSSNENNDWHSSTSLLESIRQIAASPEEIGYCSLNLNYWNWAETSPWYTSEWRDELAQAGPKFQKIQDLLLPIFEDTNVACYCCAQFAVSRGRILAHSKIVYEQLRDYLDATPWQGVDNRRCSFAERFWHILFGESRRCSKDALCPSVSQTEQPRDP